MVDDGDLNRWLSRHVYSDRSDGRPTEAALAPSEAKWLTEVAARVADRAKMPEMGTTAGKLAAMLLRKGSLKGQRVRLDPEDMRLIAGFAGLAQHAVLALNSDERARLIELARALGFAAREPTSDERARRAAQQMDQAIEIAGKALRQWWKG